MTACLDCNGPTTWDDDVGSLICTACGTLVDPSQSVLASHLDVTDTSGREYSSLWNPTTTLKSVVRGRTGWDLAGQGKEARDRKNTNAMHQFIRSLATSLSAPGLAQRASSLFSLAMARGNYRWGRTAKLTAAAALALAFREAHRPDSLLDIAFLLSEPPVSLSRAFTRTLSILDLELESPDPAQHLPALQAYLHTVLHPPTASTSSAPSTPTLSPALRALLLPISLPSAIRTAASLSLLLTRLPPHELTHLPSSPTACALVLLALEAEIRVPLPQLSPLAGVLAARVGASTGLVMGRYKIAQDLVAGCMNEVPWLVKKGKGVKGGKRAVVVRGTKDVLQFKEEIWRRKLEACGHLDVTLDVDEKDSGEESSGNDGECEEGIVNPSKCLLMHAPEPRPRKKRKLERVINETSQFLLDPLSGAVPSSAASTPSYSSASARSITPPLPLATYLLTASPSSISSRYPLTRLQLLSMARGGEAAVDDDELFAEGEWEGMMRDDDEREVVGQVMGWSDNDGEDECNDETQPKPCKKNKEKGKGMRRDKEAPQRGSKRVDMAALARLLEDDGYDGDKDYELILMDTDKENDHAYEDGLEVNAWHPLSPAAGGFEFEGRYDEEC